MNTPFDRLAEARRVLHSEATALRDVAARLDDRFIQFTEILLGCTGRVAVSGIGKSADIAQKIVGTLNSMGTRAYLLDATRAVHGDLGMVHPTDVAIVLSHSGESEEIVRLLSPLKKLCSALLSITGNAGGSLARLSDVALIYGPITETCPLALAPSTSTTVMLALGDAIAFVLSEIRQFTAEDFARFHPAGSLGRKLSSVETWMRRGEELRIAPESATVREVFTQARNAGRRTGAIMLVDAEKRLTGLFTDSDLARLFSTNADATFDGPIANVMTRRPITVTPLMRMAEALELLRSRKISELPVVDEQGQPIGLIDITDVVGLESSPSHGIFPRLHERISA